MRDHASDYELIDFGEAARLERWGHAVLARPDFRAAGARTRDGSVWEQADAVFEGRIGGGRWRLRPGRPPLPDRWALSHAGLQFRVGCAPSGHTGLFPEQAAHWGWMAGSAPEPSADRPTPPKALNLFGYTGGASVALAAAGWAVTHVDASRPAIGWARENAALNGTDSIRWIHEDARRFVDRERRRGRRYDALLLDPPAFGRGPAGTWQLDRDLGGLLEAAVGLLAPDAAFVLVNVYTGDQGATDLERLLAWALDARDGSPLVIEAGTLSLATADGRMLPTGIFARAAARPPSDTANPATSRRPTAPV